MRVITKQDISALVRLERSGGALVAAARDGAYHWALIVHKQIIAALSGKKLNVRSGRLRSKQQVPRIEVKRLVVHATFENKAEYAAIQNFGGTTKPHEIVAKRKKALKFNIGGREVFAKRVMHPGSKIKATRFMSDPIDRNMARLKAFVKYYARRAFGGRK